MDIIPTPGRVVWFTPPVHGGPPSFTHNGVAPCAAIVAYVHGPRMVNLSVFDHNGVQFSFASVTLVQEGDPKDDVNGRYCEWMPYQVGQAKKHAEPAPQIAGQGTKADGSVPLNFGAAIAALKAGLRVAREGWNGKGMWLALQVPDANSKMQRPYIYMHPADGLLVPWLASQTDMLAEDWFIVSP